MKYVSPVKVEVMIRVLLSIRDVNVNNLLENWLMAFLCCCGEFIYSNPQGFIWGSDPSTHIRKVPNTFS
jgi:hypothetical protein